jgi:hypothetical protein
MTDERTPEDADTTRPLSSEEMIREAREDVYDDDPLEGVVTPARDFADGAVDDGTEAGPVAGQPVGGGVDPTADPELPGEFDTSPGAAAAGGLGGDRSRTEPEPLWVSDPLQPTEPVPLTADPEAPPRKSPWAAILRAVVLVAIVVVGWSFVRNLLESGTDVQSLEPGDCFLEFEGTEVSSVEVVDCAEPHQFEVFANVVLPDGPYPGATEVDQAGYDACLDDFQPYVGIDYESSVWFVTTLVPLEDSWPEDRTVNCLLVQPTGEDSLPATVTGSARGTGA